MSSDEMPEEVKEEVDQVKVVNDDHDVDESDDHYDIYGDDDDTDEEVNQVQGGQSQSQMSFEMFHQVVVKTLSKSCDELER